MKYRRLGNSDLEISVLGMGSWAIGGKAFGPVYDSDSRKAIFRALDMGVTFFDTAPLYGNGHAEEVLGKALQGVRQDVLIATKVGPSEPMPGVLSVNLSASSIREQLIGSLGRLQTDYVDLVQIHWWDERFDLDEAIGALLDLKKEGLAREIGVSNFDVDLMGKVGTRVASLQPPCSLIDCPQRCELFGFCRENGVGIIAYSPLAKGLLTGKFHGPVRFHEWDVRRRDPDFSGEHLAANLAFVQSLENVADSIGVPLHHLALAWVVAQPGMTAAIFGAKTAVQVGSNAGAADVVLDRDVLAEIDELRKRYLEVTDAGCVD